MMKWIAKTFDELTTHELYAILRLRSEVFCVEQTCVFQDMDNMDQLAVHLMGYQEANGTERSTPGHKDELVAYARIFAPEIKYDMSSIGRVVIKQEARGTGAGRALMVRSIEELESRFGKVPVKISAQAHLETFYGSLGFESTGEPYDEDGIPHIDMIRELA
jgi:ElaA protein